MKTVSKLHGPYWRKKEPSTLRELREDNDFTLRQVAKWSGISLPTLSRLESGRPPSIRVALRLAEFYETSVEILFGEKKRNV